ncbi:reverse transcriptase domain-containing protein [Tanacetum coccineum]
MDDTRTMAQLLEAPTVGYEDAIVVPETRRNSLRTTLSLACGFVKPSFKNNNSLDMTKKDPVMLHPLFQQDHFYDEVPNVPKQPPRSILTWEDLVSKFINKFFPPSKTTNLRNEITRFQQRFDETFYEAWDRFNDLLRACPNLGFSELHQLDTFYNALNSNDQDSLNSAAGGNFLNKMPRDCLRIIEIKSKVRNSRNKLVVAKVSSSSSTPGISPDVAELKDMVKALLLDKKNQTQAPAPVKAVEESCVTCGGAHSYRNCPPPMAIGVAYQGPTIPTTSYSPPKVVERETEVKKDTVLPTNNGSTKHVQPPFPILFSVGCQKPGDLSRSRLGCAEKKVATWDDLAFKLITFWVERDA